MDSFQYSDTMTEFLVLIPYDQQLLRTIVKKGNFILLLRRQREHQVTNNSGLKRGLTFLFLHTALVCQKER